MISLAKFVGFFSLVVVLLSITANEKTFFSHIYRIISPVTISTQRMVGDALNSSLATAQEYTKKIFENSVPKHKDTLRTKVSAPSRKSSPSQESIMAEEKEELDELIKTQY